MSIQTVLANVSCNHLETSIAWYAKLFGKPPARQPMAGLAEWHLTDTADVQLFEEKAHAGASTLTLGVAPLAAERDRLVEAGIECGAIEHVSTGDIVLIRDPDHNLVVLASPRKA
jgi:hypothetical protein